MTEYTNFVLAVFSFSAADMRTGPTRQKLKISHLTFQIIFVVTLSLSPGSMPFVDVVMSFSPFFAL